MCPHGTVPGSLVTCGAHYLAYVAQHVPVGPAGDRLAGVP
jgi:hypothetical protein